MDIFPLTDWQNYLIAFEEDRDASLNFLTMLTIDAAFLVKPGLDERRLKRAFKRLCERHDITRMHFHRLGGTWKCVIKDEVSGGLQVHDHTGASEDQIATLVDACAAGSLPMIDAPLFRLDLLKFAEHGDVVVLRANHAITDGFGLTILAEDLLALLIGLPFTKPVVSYQEYFRTWGRGALPISPEVEDFWTQKLMPPPGLPDLGRIKRGLPLLANGIIWKRSKTLRFDVPEQQASLLEKRVRTDGVSAFMLVNTAFMEAVADHGTTDDFLYSVTLGRSQGRLANYAGHHTLHPLIRHRSKSGQPLLETARNAAHELLQASQNLQTSAVQHAGDWDRKLLEAGAYPRQIATGPPSSSARINTSAFSSFLGLGANKALNFGGMEVTRMNSRLPIGDLDELGFRPDFDARGGVMEFSYDAEAFDDDEIEQIARTTFARVDLDPGGHALRKN